MQGAVLRKEKEQEGASVSFKYGVTEFMTPAEAVKIARGQMPPCGGNLSKDFMMRLRADVDRHTASEELVREYLSAFRAMGGDIFGQAEFRRKYLLLIQQKLLNGGLLPEVLLKGKRANELVLVGAILATVPSSDSAFAVFAELWQHKVKV